MRVFITGSSGFIGRNLVRLLSNRDDLYLYKRGEDVGEAVKVFQPDIIYNLAAETKKEETMYESNFLLTRQLLEASEQVPFKAFVQVGSSSEYGITSEPMNEGDFCQPLSYYGKTKLLATELAQFYAGMSMKNIFVLRLFSVYGTNERPERYFPRLINTCLKGEPLDYWPGNHDWIHVDDVVSALQYFSYRQLPGEIINVGTGIMTSNLQVVRLVEKYTGVKADLRRHCHLKNSCDSRIWVSDTRKSFALGWKPLVTLEEGLRREIDELKGEG